MPGKDIGSLPPSEKFSLTVSEAAAYFGIGQKKIRQLAEIHEGEGMFTRNGCKLIIHRIAFERFLSASTDI